MEPAQLTGFLVSLFNEASVFHKLVQQKLINKNIQFLESFVSALVNNRRKNQSDFKILSDIFLNAVKINPQYNNAISLRQIECKVVLESMFRYILSIPCFINWETRTGSYFLEVPVPSSPANEFARTSQLLSVHLKSDLIKNPPSPALVIHLIRHDQGKVLPSLEVHLEEKQNGEKFGRKVYCLQTVICQTAHYKIYSFIRKGGKASETTWKCVIQNELNNFSSHNVDIIENHIQFVNNLKTIDSVPAEVLNTTVVAMMERCLFLVYVPITSTAVAQDEAVCGQLIDVDESKNVLPQSTMNAAHTSPPSTPQSVEFPQHHEWKGIHGYENSCFIDSLLMSWLFQEDNQTAFLHVIGASIHRFNRLQQANKISDVKCLVDIIGTIALSLKSDPPYCRRSVTWELRKLLSKHNSNICGEMLDVTEFINVLFGRCLGADYFATYRPIHGETSTVLTKEIGSYLHQIIIGRVEKLEPVDIATLLERSLKLQGIRFKVHPEPFLIIKLPLNNGRLVGVEYVIPSLQLTIGDTVEETGVAFEYELTAIICLQDMHYTAFIRKWKDDWIFFDSMSPRLIGPEIEFLNGFTHDLMKDPVSENEMVQKVLHKSCLYIYTRIQTSNLFLTDSQAEQGNELTQSICLPNENMQLAGDEVGNSCASVTENAVETFIGGCEPRPRQVPGLNSNIVDSDQNTTTEMVQISHQAESISPDKFAILECLLCLMQSYRTSLCHILQGITEKLKTKTPADGSMSSKEIQACNLSEYIDWSKQVQSNSQSQFCSVWNKLVKFTEGETGNNSCLELYTNGSPWSSVRELYHKHQCRNGTSPHGLVISLERNAVGQEKIGINTILVQTTSEGQKTLKLFCVICSIKNEGLITYIFDPSRECWTKKYPHSKVQSLQSVSNCWLEFAQGTELTNQLSDSEILDYHSIGLIYTRYWESKAKKMDDLDVATQCNSSFFV